MILIFIAPVKALNFMFPKSDFQQVTIWAVRCLECYVHSSQFYHATLHLNAFHLRYFCRSLPIVF